MFGGFDGQKTLAETWIWDNGPWLPIVTSIAPAARTGFDMCTAPGGEDVLLFGGSSGTTVFDDTWIWNGQEWHLLKPGTKPSPRKGHATAYDPDGDVVVLFGGHDPKTGTTFGDTWQWDGFDWRKLAVTGPPPRRGHRMVTANKQLFLYGGWNRVGAEFRVYGDVWYFKDSKWTQLQIYSQPEPKHRTYHGMAYDPIQGHLCIFGGDTLIGGKFVSLDDTWNLSIDQWNFGNWTQINMAAPPVARRGHAMVYDPRRYRPFLHGGSDGAARFDGDFRVLNVAESWQRLAPVDRMASTTEAILDEIKKAGPYDRIIVGRGDYEVQGIDFLGKSLQLIGKDAAGLTTLRGRGAINPASVLVLQSGETAGAVIEGFTISGGAGTVQGASFVGGGIFCANGSNPTIRRNIIVNNHLSTRGFGGGICCENSSPIIYDNRIAGNQVSLGAGAGIYCAGKSKAEITGNLIEGNTGDYSKGGGIAINSFSDHPVVRDNRIKNNKAMQGGGVFCAIFTEPMIDRNIVELNHAMLQGGGLFCEMCTPYISFNTIRGNIADDGRGGGIFCYLQAKAQIISNTITGNEAKLSSGDGGGIASEFSSVVIENNVIAQNVSASQGGGIFSDRSSDLITNNTVYMNTAAHSGGGIASTRKSDPKLVNTTIEANESKSNLGHEIYVGPGIGGTLPAQLEADVANVQGGWLRIRVDTNSGSTLTTTSPILNLPAQFVHAAGGDFHLTSKSPIINRGNHLRATTFDIDGNPRISADISADEHYPHIYVLGDQVPDQLIKIKMVGPGEDTVIFAVGPETFPKGQGLRISGIGVLRVKNPFLIFAAKLDSRGVLELGEYRLPKGTRLYMQALVIGGNMTDVTSLDVRTRGP